MNGLVASYELSGKIGYQIAEIKGYDEAWSHPTFLTKFIKNMGPLVYYDKIYLDQTSYESYFDKLQSEYRTKLKNCIESKRLGIFESINIQDPLHQDTENLVAEIKNQYSDLVIDNQFKNSVDKLEKIWGNRYANPKPLNFECMNIPLISILLEKWSKEKGELYLIDDIERAALFKIKDKKKMLEIFIPGIAEILFEVTPKFPFITPNLDEWNEDDVLRLREDENIKHYKKKVEKLSKSAKKKFENTLKNNFKLLKKNYGFDLNSKKDTEVIAEIYFALNEIKKEVIEEVMKSYQSIFKIKVIDEFDILGIILGLGGLIVEGIPGLQGIGFPMTGIGISGTSSNVFRKYLKRKNIKWMEFFYFPLQD